MTIQLVAAAVLLCLLHLTLLADAAYYSYRYSSYSYYSYYYYNYYGYIYSYSFTCSVSCIAGAVVGGLVFLGLLIGLCVFTCFYCKAAKKRSVQPAATSFAMNSQHHPVSTVSGGVVPLYPTQQHQQQHQQPAEPQPPAYDESQMYPPNRPTTFMYPPATEIMEPDTAYPPGPPPAYSTAAGSSSLEQQT